MAKKILVIDDEELVIYSLKRLLKREGYEVTVASNGAEALELIKETDFDLVVSDIRMPELDGIEVVRKMREYFLENNKNLVPVVLITGYSNDESAKQAQELKVVDYLHKPFDTVDFLKVIKINLEDESFINPPIEK